MGQHRAVLTRAGQQEGFGRVDAAVIAGLPASKAAKKHVSQAQKPDFLMTEAHLASDPVGWRRLYFRKLFS